MLDFSSLSILTVIIEFFLTAFSIFLSLLLKMQPGIT